MSFSLHFVTCCLPNLGLKSLPAPAPGWGAVFVGGGGAQKGSGEFFGNLELLRPAVAAAVPESAPHPVSELTPERVGSPRLQRSGRNGVSLMQGTMQGTSFPKS